MAGGGVDNKWILDHRRLITPIEDLHRLCLHEIDSVNRWYSNSA